MKNNFFIFFDIPDFIVKKGYTRKDYEDTLLKVLQKIKLRYLAEKARELPHKDLDAIVITDDDLVPFDIIDHVLTEINHKKDERFHDIEEFIKKCNVTVKTKIEKSGIDSDKLKKVI